MLLGLLPGSRRATYPLGDTAVRAGRALVAAYLCARERVLCQPAASTSAAYHPMIRGNKGAIAARELAASLSPFRYPAPFLDGTDRTVG